MWAAIAIIVGLILGIAAMGSFGFWGLPVVVLIVIAIAAYFARSRKEGEPLGTMERKKKVEPSGRPRAATGGGDTANERVGQA